MVVSLNPHQVVSPLKIFCDLKVDGDGKPHMIKSAGLRTDPLGRNILVAEDNTTRKMKLCSFLAIQGRFLKSGSKKEKNAI